MKDQISGLEDQLRIIEDEQSCPVDLESYINKLNLAKKRIMVVNNILQGAQVNISMSFCQQSTFEISWLTFVFLFAIFSQCQQWLDSKPLNLGLVADCSTNCATGRFLFIFFSVGRPFSGVIFTKSITITIL